MVARETSISEGLSALGVPASDQAIRRLARLAELLENDAVDLGFLGPNEGHRVVSRHILESAALVSVLPPDGPVVDIGSGSGLPGMVLAVLGRPVVMIDSLAKRTDFLRAVATDLGVDAEVRTSRAEDEGRRDLRDSASAAVARALAPPAVTLELCLPFVRPGGVLAMLGSPRDRELVGPTDPTGSLRPGEGAGTRETEVSSAREEPEPTAAEASRTDDSASVAAPGEPVADPARTHVARLLGGDNARWQRLTVPGADAPRWVMIVDKRDPTPERFPRRSGAPAFWSSSVLRPVPSRVRPQLPAGGRLKPWPMQESW
jgi:16S rRNA (guanine527-N7)-methyltransferase